MQDNVEERMNTLQAGLPGLFPGSLRIEEVTVTVDGVGLILSRKVQEDDPPTAWLKRG